MSGPTPLSLAEFTRRFWRRVDKTSSPHGCWLWIGGHSGNGYGVVNARALFKHPQNTHVVAWLLMHGKIRRGKYVLHKCNVQLCVRPAHLYLGTQKENSADSKRAGTFGIGKRTSGTWYKGDPRLRRAQRIRWEGTRVA